MKDNSQQKVQASRDSVVEPLTSGAIYTAQAVMTLLH